MTQRPVSWPLRPPVVEVDAALALELAAPLRMFVNAEQASGNTPSADMLALVVAVERLAAQPLDRAALEKLTPAEMRVALLVAKGCTDVEIGAQLFISRRTVESHVLSARQRLGLPNRAALASQISSSPDVPQMVELVDWIA